MPTTRQLELFVAIADAGSMRKAADRLGISQPSISKQIRALERKLGGELVERNRGGRATLSRLGLDVLADARTSVDIHHRLARRAPNRPRSRSQIYMRSYLCEAIKRRLSEFREGGLPDDTTFHVSDDPLGTMMAERGGPNVFAIFGSIGLPPRKNFVSHVVREQKCSVYASPEIARAIEQGRRKLADMVGLLPDIDSNLTPWLAERLARIGIGPQRQVAHTQFMDLLVQRVRNGEGVAIFLDPHVESMVEHGVLVPVARVEDPLLLVLMAHPDVESDVFERVCRAFHML
jgi:molybdate transport repressor ModE-like protein